MGSRKPAQSPPTPVLMLVCEESRGTWTRRGPIGSSPYGLNLLVKPVSSPTSHPGRSLLSYPKGTQKGKGFHTQAGLRAPRPSGREPGPPTAPGPGLARPTKEHAVAERGGKPGPLSPALGSRVRLHQRGGDRRRTVFSHLTWETGEDKRRSPARALSAGRAEPTPETRGRAECGAHLPPFSTFSNGAVKRTRRGESRASGRLGKGSVTRPVLREAAAPAVLSPGRPPSSRAAL